MKQTSINAYHESRTQAEKHREVILNVMKQAKKPLSSLQISTKCYLDYYQVARRMSELEEAGKIVDTGLKAVNPSGCKAAMYRLKVDQLQLEGV